MILGRKGPIDSNELLDMLASGKPQKVIAAEKGLKLRALGMRVSRYLQAKGFTTTEQAVAHHVAEKLRR